MFLFSFFTQQSLSILNVIAYFSGNHTALDGESDENDTRHKNRPLEILACFILSGLGILLLVGVLKRMPILIRTYMWTFLTFKTIVFVLIAFILFFDTFLGVVLLVLFLFNSYFLLTVNTYYLQLSDELQQCEPLQSAEPSKEMVP